MAWGRKVPPPDGPALAVSELTAQIKAVLQADFAAVKVVGEVSDLARPRSGHLYFTLKDPGAQLKAVIWKSTAARLPLDLTDGLEVVAWGRIDVYPPRGNYQLIVEGLEPLGGGALERALRKLREKLAKEGLFDADRKHPLPKFPQRIAVITSPTSAALRDFLEVLQRRWRGSRVWVVPSQMQGDEAAEEVIAALRTVHRLRPRPDVVVVTRGGGSIEDLWAFNDERLVRTIAAAEIPVVSAIGHEIDVTLTDLVADLRALTPSEAAERVVPSRQELGQRLDVDRRRLRQAVVMRLKQARMRLESLQRRPVLREPKEWIYERQLDVDRLAERMSQWSRRVLERRRDQVTHLARRLHSLDPRAVLARGYSITRRKEDGQVVQRADAVTPGEEIETILAEGSLLSRVLRVEPPSS